MFRQWIVLVLLSAGCFMQNASAGERLQDSVTELNDHARWGRSHAALRVVHPLYQSRFAESRQAWGKDLQVADVDVQDVKMEEDKESATAAIGVSWYRLNDMQLRSTVIEQQWKRDGDGYRLAMEKVVDGDRALLEIQR